MLYILCALTRLKNLKVEKILKGSLDSIPSPSPSLKIQANNWSAKKIPSCLNSALVSIVILSD